MNDLSTILSQALFSSDSEELTLTDALLKIAYQLKNLGNADASTSMGAIEALGAVQKDGFEAISSSLQSIAEAIGNVSGSLDRLNKNLGSKS